VYLEKLVAFAMGTICGCGIYSFPQKKKKKKKLTTRKNRKEKIVGGPLYKKKKWVPTLNKISREFFDILFFCSYGSGVGGIKQSSCLEG
jgi:hypothetical protein